MKQELTWPEVLIDLGSWRRWHFVMWHCLKLCHLTYTLPYLPLINIYLDSSFHLCRKHSCNQRKCWSRDQDHTVSRMSRFHCNAGSWTKVVQPQSKTYYRLTVKLPYIQAAYTLLSRLCSSYSMSQTKDILLPTFRKNRPRFVPYLVGGILLTLSSSLWPFNLKMVSLDKVILQKTNPKQAFFRLELSSFRL